jgi:V/A-type H+-transporting ATPase subunit A
MQAIMRYGDAAQEALKSGVPISELIKMDSKNELPKVKFEENFDASMNAVLAKMDKEFASLRGR